MATSAILRVILGTDNSQRVVFPAGLPTSVTDLETDIKSQCQLKQPFRLQFMDTLFGNDFQNLTSMEEIKDMATVKVIYTPTNSPLDSVYLPANRPDDHDSPCTSIILPSPEATTSRSLWPDQFIVPRFGFDAELKLDQANSACREKGSCLIPDPKLKSDILEGVIQEVVLHKVYLTDREFEQAAEALIIKHPCLREKGSVTGYGGWKTSLKYKLSNYRTHLRKIGCPEVCVNALRNKPEGKRNPAFAVKKPKRGEVAFYPSNPLGECDQSLDTMRVELLSDVQQRNNRATVKAKMDKTFPLRRREVIGNAPMISDFQVRWPALFDVVEINLEFKRITTMPLQSRFLSQLDLLTGNLLKVFEKRSGQQGQKLKDMSAMVTEDIDAGRECIIKGLCIYLNEDPEDLVQEYVEMAEMDFLSATERTTVGIYVVRDTPSSEPSDVRIVLEGVMVLQDLENVALASATLFGLFYALNLQYPSKLRYTFEAFQKIIMELDAGELSKKAQSLKTKLCQ